jgi:hypothetical protein
MQAEVADGGAFFLYKWSAFFSASASVSFDSLAPDLFFT